jgi:hypothetical protein
MTTWAVHICHNTHNRSQFAVFAWSIQLYDTRAQFAWLSTTSTHYREDCDLCIACIVYHSVPVQPMLSRKLCSCIIQLY